MTKPDYGLDAPGLVRNFLRGGGITWLVALLVFGFVPAHWWSFALAGLLLLLGSYLAGVKLFL